MLLFDAMQALKLFSTIRTPCQCPSIPLPLPQPHCIPLIWKDLQRPINGKLINRNYLIENLSITHKKKKKKKAKPWSCLAKNKIKNKKRPDLF